MENTANKKSIKVPHIMVIFAVMIIIMCLLTYILPAGKYDFDANGRAIAGSYHFIERNPVNPWKALLMLQQCVIESGLIMALMLGVGSAICVMIETGALDEVVAYALYKLRDKSVPVLIPLVIVIFSLIGAFAGNDSMMAFVTVGMLFCRRVKLDSLVAVGMFYLSVITGQACGPTIMLCMVAQQMAGLPPISIVGIRMTVWAVLTAWCAIYVTRYAWMIHKDPSKSIMGKTLVPRPGEEEIKEVKPTFRSFAVLFVMVGAFVFYAFGAVSYGWSYDWLIALSFAGAILCSAFYKVNPNVVGARFLQGAKDMGGVCLMLGIAKIVGMVLSTGNIMHTITHGVVLLVQDLGPGFAAIGVFFFILIFNILVYSGTSKAFVVMPILTPMADVIGMSRQVLCVAFQLGDGFTNPFTPMSPVTMGSLALADDCPWDKWVKFLLPFMIVNIIFGSALIYYLQYIGLEVPLVLP
jgi:uncharacterized ion transporter superfamily protein YfcC